MYRITDVTSQTPVVSMITHLIIYVDQIMYENTSFLNVIWSIHPHPELFPYVKDLIQMESIDSDICGTLQV